LTHLVQADKTIFTRSFLETRPQHKPVAGDVPYLLSRPWLQTSSPS